MVPFPYSLAAGALLLVAVGVGGYWRGYSAADWECEAARNAEIAAHIEELNRETERADAISQEFSEWRRKHASKRAGYAAAAGDLRDCSVPVSFVRLYNASVTSSDYLPEAASGPSCAASTASTDTVAAVVADNNAACNEYIEQLNKLIDWHTP